MYELPGYKIVVLNRTISFTFLAIIVAVVASFIGYQLWVGGNTMPNAIEGFAGPSRGAGIPDCMRTSSEGAELYGLFLSKPQTTEEGPADLHELQALLGKLACLKRDLMGPSGLVEATYKQPFRTTQDMEPVAETAARCFAKTIPRRDLELAIDKWNTRGKLLVRRLCTSANFTDADLAKANDLFKRLMIDITDVMRTMCLKGPVSIAGQEGPRMISGYEPPALENLREYKGYY
jgi:hypothetical protein